MLFRSVTVGLTRSLKEGEVVVASFFKGNRLIKIEKKDTAIQSGVAFAIPTGADKIKTMIWDGFDAMRPLCNKRELKL